MNYEYVRNTLEPITYVYLKSDWLRAGVDDLEAGTDDATDGERVVAWLLRLCGALIEPDDVPSGISSESVSSRLESKWISNVFRIYYQRITYSTVAVGEPYAEITLRNDNYDECHGLNNYQVDRYPAYL